MNEQTRSSDEEKEKLFEVEIICADCGKKMGTTFQRHNNPTHSQCEACQAKLYKEIERRRKEKAEGKK